MREIHLNGYIDDEIWYGDEITPASLHDELYPQDAQPGEDVRIILNSYGGSCKHRSRQRAHSGEHQPDRQHAAVCGSQRHGWTAGWHPCRAVRRDLRDALRCPFCRECRQE